MKWNAIIDRKGDIGDKLLKVEVIGSIYNVELEWERVGVGWEWCG